PSRAPGLRGRRERGADAPHWRDGRREHDDRLHAGRAVPPGDGGGRVGAAVRRPPKRHVLGARPERRRGLGHTAAGDARGRHPALDPGLRRRGRKPGPGGGGRRALRPGGPGARAGGPWGASGRRGGGARGLRTAGAARRRSIYISAVIFRPRTGSTWMSTAIVEEIQMTPLSILS